MKPFKRILSILLCLIILLSANGFCNSNTITAEASKKKTYQQRAEEILKTMTLKEKVYQMILAQIPDKNATKYQKQNQYGGYVLFAKNFENHTPKSKKKQIQGYQDVSKIKMLIAVDEEGGTVNRVSKFKQYSKKPCPSPRSVYNNGGLNNVEKDTKQKSKMLKKIGINTNLAPVADVPYSRNDYMYSRAFSTNASTVSKCIKTVVNQMEKDNVVSTLKHFPGYGGNKNTHSQICKDNRSLSTFKKRDLKPFQAGIDAGCDMIMISHNIVKAFSKKPASISGSVQKYLRNEMGFEGVIVTDGLGMKGIVDYVGGDKGEIAVKAILAGNDMICANAPVTQGKALYKAAKSGRITEKRINNSVKRILIMKLKRGIIK